MPLDRSLRAGSDSMGQCDWGEIGGLAYDSSLPVVFSLGRLFWRGCFFFSLIDIPTDNPRDVLNERKRIQGLPTTGSGVWQQLRSSVKQRSMDVKEIINCREPGNEAERCARIV